MITSTRMSDAPLWTEKTGCVYGTLTVDSEVATGQIWSSTRANVRRVEGASLEESDEGRTVNIASSPSSVGVAIKMESLVLKVTLPTIVAGIVCPRMVTVRSNVTGAVSGSR